jgi:tripartite-type tricarboxylate transporter receptor subunit TctC
MDCSFQNHEEDIMNIRWTGVSLLAAIFALTAVAPYQYAHAYPERPIRLIVPFAPGGTADFSARLVAEGLTQQLGQQVVVDNRGGAGGVLGTALVAKAAPDGYTLSLNNIALSVNETMQPDRPYRALEDFAPISLIGAAPNTLVVNVDTPIKSVKDLIKLAKAQPGKIAYGSAGPGSATHLSMAYLESMAGIKLLHVPYKGGGPAIAAVMGGEVQCLLTPVPTAFPHVQAGRVRPIGVSSSKRASALPDVPTIAEAGVPGYEFTTWFGLLAPARTPKAVITRLHEATLKSFESPELRKKLVQAGLEPQTTTPGEFTAFIRAEIAKWRKVIEEAGIARQ